jgi:hypothetical protein
LVRQLSIDMLQQGYHQSFRDLCAILTWQKQDRKRLGTEHPLHRRELLDNEPEKLRFLCLHLNKAEEAQRQRTFSRKLILNETCMIVFLRCLCKYLQKLSFIGIVLFQN